MSSSVPEGWKKLKMGNIGTFSTSSVNKKSKDNEISVSLLNYMDIYQNSVLSSSYRFQQVTAPAKQVTSSFVRNGDVFFTPSSETPNDIGHSAVFLGDAGSLVHSYHTIRFRLNEDDYFDDNYKAYAFKEEATYEYFLKRAAGSTRFTVSLPIFNELEVLAPPLPEQKKIASILTSVDEVIENTQKQINKLQDLKKATMEELLTKGIGHTEFKDSELGRIPKSWEVVPVEELCSEIIDCVNKTAPVSEKPTPFKMIRTSNVRNGLIDIENVRFVSEETFAVWTRRGTLKEGDIVFTREAPVGEYGLVTKPEGLFLGQRTMLYRPNEKKTNPSYLIHCFATNLTKNQLEGMTDGSTVGHMRVPDCSKIKFLKCPLEEQNAIVKVLSSIDQRIDRMSMKHSQTQSLKKSLMQDLLTGKVRVTVN